MQLLRAVEYKQRVIYYERIKKENKAADATDLAAAAAAAVAAAAAAAEACIHLSCIYCFLLNILSLNNALMIIRK